jgi:hypothetical protein
MTKYQQLNEEWTPLPPGTLATLAGHERTRQRRRFLFRAGSTVGALALASGAGWLVFQSDRQPTEPTFGGIACSRVRALAPQFMKGQLDEKVTQQILAHLEQCNECRAWLESMQPKTAARLPHGQSAGQCPCSTCRRDRLGDSLAAAKSPVMNPTT